MSYLSNKKNCLFKREKLAKNSRSSIGALEKGKVKKLDQELTKSKETTCSIKRSVSAL
jgi:hypothetical protein